jgi:hypothetical protein
MKHVKKFESFLNEALTSKKPNDIETIELDMAWDDSNPEEVKAVKAAWKKFNIKVKQSSAPGPMQGGTYEVTGKKKDILAYLQSEFYEMDGEDIKEFYPELLEGNSEDDLSVEVNENAFHVALYKARNEGAKEFKFNGKTYPVKERKIEEGFEVHYSDGVRGSQKFADKGKALAFAKDKIKNSKGLQDIAIYNASSGFHSTADDKYLLAWWGDGSYWDNVSKNDDGIKSKKIDESEINEAVLSKSAAYHLAHKMLNYAVDHGMIPASKKTKEHVDSLSDSLFNAKLDLKKDPRGAAHKVLNGLVDRGLIPASKKTEDHVSRLADRLEEVELNEAMVQIAGHNKPSGARVLATVILDYLEDQNVLKLSSTSIKNTIHMEMTELIMNSTF